MSSEIHPVKCQRPAKFTRLTFFQLTGQISLGRGPAHCENAVLTQIFVAMITYLLLAIMKHMSKIGKSMQHILQIMQLHLMDKVSIEDLFGPPEPKKKNCKFKQLPLIS